jgi:hypothetical protein
MSDIQTTDEVTEQTEPVTLPENTKETVAPEPTASEVTEQTSPEPQPEPYKEKFVASQRESILNNERVKVANARLESLTKQDTPTDEGMKALYPEWDNLDEYNKRVLIRQETIAMQNAKVIAEQQELRDRQRLEDELDSVIETNAKLRGKESDFKRFARSPKNRGISADVLAKAFLFDAEEDSAPTPTNKPTGLPAGNGGPRGPLKPKKISLEESKILRETNYREYKRLLNAGMFEELE